MQDYINEAGDTSLEAAVLKGGIKGWVKTYEGQQMDAYDPKVWKEETKGETK